MKTSEFEIFDVEIEKLSPLGDSYRNTSEALNYLIESIKTFGFRPENPLLITRDFKVIQGKLRLQAAKACKLKTVPCMYCNKELNKDELIALSIADNKTSEYATWDYEKLKIEIEDISQTDIKLNVLGFDVNALDELLADAEIESNFIGEVAPDYIPEIDEKIDSKLDTIYSLGDNHRLLVCKPADTSKYKQLLFDGEPKCYLSDFKSYCCDDNTGVVFTLGVRELANGGVFYAKTNNVNYFNYLQLANSLDVEVNETLIWSQSTYVNLGDTYIEQGLPILYGWRKQGKRKWYNDKKQGSILEQKSPIYLWQYFIFNSTSSGDIVFDNFGNYGDVLIASQVLNRRSRIVVSDVKQADIIRKRYAEFVYGKDCDWITLTPKFVKEKKK